MLASFFRVWWFLRAPSGFLKHKPSHAGIMARLRSSYVFVLGVGGRLSRMSGGVICEDDVK